MTIHVTPIPSAVDFGTPAQVYTTANDAGAASTAIRTDSEIAIFNTSGGAAVVSGATGQAGSQAFASRQDHTHTVPALLAVSGDTPDSIEFSQSGSAGTGTAASRSDHAHAMAANPFPVISTVVASDDATLTLTGITSSYDTYLIVGSDLVPIDNDVDMYMRCGAGSIDSGAGNYEYHLQYSRTTVSTYEAMNSAASTRIQIAGNSAIGGVGNVGGEGAGFCIWLHAPTDGTMKPGFSGSHVMVNGSGTPAGGPLYGFRDAVIAIDRVQILMESGNIATGRFTLMGVPHG